MRTQEELEKKLAEIENDDRLHYPAARIDVNALLALIQMGLYHEANALRWALGLSRRSYYGSDG